MSNMLFLELQDNILEKVANTFEKTEDTLKTEVKEIRKWLKTQHHLPELMDERLVRNFYLLNKCRMEKTKEKIDNYYTVRSQSRDIFGTINPKLANMKFFMEAVYFIPLPKLTEDMYRVLVYKIRDPEKFNNVNPYDIIRHFVNLMEIKLHEDVTFGDVCLIDVSNIPLTYVLKITPLFLYKVLIVIYEKIYSSRLKAFYMINSPGYIRNVMELMKRIMKPKLAARIDIYNDYNIVNEKISNHILPKDFGGSEKSLEELRGIRKLVQINSKQINSLSEMLINKFYEYQDRFDQLDEFRVDETLRPRKEKSSKFLGLW